MNRCGDGVTRRFQNIPHVSARLPTFAEVFLALTRRKPLSHKGADVAELVDALDLGYGAGFRKAQYSDTLSFLSGGFVAHA